MLLVFLADPPFLIFEIGFAGWKAESLDLDSSLSPAFPKPSSDVRVWLSSVAISVDCIPAIDVEKERCKMKSEDMVIKT